MSEFKERPILFSAEMVRALLAGTKTQTRRMVAYPRWAEAEFELEEQDSAEGLGLYAIAKSSGCLAPLECPYGKPGDRLFVREAWKTATVVSSGHEIALYRADGKFDGPWKPSIHMPCWASRITLEITEVRVQRLQDISAEDAAAEGIQQISIGDDRAWAWPSFDKDESHYLFAEDSYASLWDSIHGQDSWNANPYVWVVSFKVVHPQELVQLKSEVNA